MSLQIRAKKKKERAEDAQGTLPAASTARTAEFCGSMSLLGTRASDTQVTSLNSHQQLP